MISSVMEWLRKKWWGLLVAYALVVAGCYSAIWTVIEPLGIPDTLECPLWPVLIKRSTYHIAASVFIGSHLTLILILLVRKRDLATAGVLPEKVIQPPPFDKGYTVAESKEFYDAIAEHYDQRNSPSLLRTHAEVIKTIKATIDGRTDIQVLDLGGGTGKLIAHHFFDRSDIHWVYVDQSALMVDQFRKNLDGTKLSRTVEVEEINTYIKRAPDRLYDTIIISLVLTSMDKTPDLTSLAARLKHNGRLIVAEIDAAYTATYPYYIVTCGSLRHAMRPRPVPLTQLIHEAGEANLRLDHSHPILEGHLNYGFVASFAKT